MNLINVQGNIYLDGRLIGSPGQDYLKAKQYGTTTAVDLVIVAAAHAGSEDIVIAGLDYRGWKVNGTSYKTVAATVAGINAVLQADYELPAGTVLPADVDASAMQVTADAAAGELYTDSGTVKIKA